VVGEAGVEPAQPKRPVYSRVFSPHDQLALGVPDGYRPRSYPGHGRVPRYLGPGTAVPSGGAAPPASPVWTERQQAAELSRHKLGRISADDTDGYHRVMCPAVMAKLGTSARPTTTSAPPPASRRKPASAAAKPSPASPPARHNSRSVPRPSHQHRQPPSPPTTTIPRALTQAREPAQDPRAVTHKIIADRSARYPGSQNVGPKREHGPW
jgi:hypothetical protein